MKKTPHTDIIKITKSNFDEQAIEVFRYQAKENKVYANYLQQLAITPSSVTKIKDIPFLPIRFFKTHHILTGSKNPERIFESSGTTGTDKSRHFIADLSLYERSFLSTFRSFYGNPENFCILALLPGYLEQQNSSLVYMVDHLIKSTAKTESGFYLFEEEELIQQLKKNENEGRKTLLFGVSFALLDLAEKFSFTLNNTIIMETGGMKGRRKEMIREELHDRLKSAFGVKEIHSEYGMTELLSQAYSCGKGVFCSPPWMKVLVRDIYDPFEVHSQSSGGINIIDLANLHSCSFIATDDLGKVAEDGSFQVLGRIDYSDVRGCNLMV